MTDHICSDHLFCSLGHPPSIIRLLHELGHFAAVDENGFAVGGPTYEETWTLSLSDEATKDAVASYQRFRPWLVEDGKFEEKTHFASQQEIGCRCGCPDIMRARGGLAYWPPDCQGEVTTSFDSKGLKYDFDGKTPAEIWDDGNAVWNVVCGVVLSSIQPGKAARITAIMGSMGGSTLAWSYLADGSCASRLRQEYNRAKTWDLHSFLWVNAHEKGHALGLGHTGQSGNIMQPYYSPGLSKLGPWEIEQVVKRYGPSVATPPPTPEPPAPGPTPTVTVDGGLATIVLSDGTSHELDLLPRAKAPKE